MNAPFLPPDLDVRRHRRLWALVAQLAIDDLKGIGASVPRRERAGLMHDARRWFRSDRVNIGSFIWICCILDIDPDQARARILKGK